MQRQFELKAILESDMGKILDELGLLELIDGGKVRCLFCKKKISRENIYCVVVKDGEIKLCCNRIECYEKLAMPEVKRNDG